jgi:hypothetical protein
MAKHIISTLSADTKYTQWARGPGLNQEQRSVLVRGGAGVALRGAGQQVYTPDGIRTEVSDDDAVFLAAHPQFQQHMARGFVKIVDRPLDADTVAQRMEDDTGSNPKTPADVKLAAEEAARKSGGLAPDETLQVVQNKNNKK